jgi:hypothetical protein
MGKDELEREHRKHREILSQLVQNKAPSGGQAAVDAADMNAKYYTYLLANPTFHSVAAGLDNRNTIDHLYHIFDDEIKTIVTKGAKDFGRLYGDKLIDHALEVLNEPRAKPIAQVNAVRFLARSAVLGVPRLGDALVKIVQAPGTKEGQPFKYNDAVRYWALRGLRDLLALPPQDMPPLPREKLEPIAAALREQIQRKVEFTTLAPPDEREGYRVLRREAIRALGQVRAPMVGKERPALVLLSVVAGDNFVPPLRWDERLEAAIGLARMRPPEKSNDYQPSYAAEQIARFLNDFTGYVQNENKTDKKPVHGLAAQLQDELVALGAETRDAYVASLFGAGKPGHRLLDRLKRGDPADPSELNAAVDASRAPAGRLFDSLPDSKASTLKTKE